MRMNYYVCPICGNVVEKVIDHDVEIFCCNQSMRKLTCGEYPELAAKHIPISKYENGKLNVRVGMIEHPMLPEHHIAFITVTYGNTSIRKELHPYEKPEATFDIGDYKGSILVESYCNIHGLWCNEIIL